MSGGSAIELTSYHIHKLIILSVVRIPIQRNACEFGKRPGHVDLVLGERGVGEAAQRKNSINVSAACDWESHPYLGLAGKFHFLPGWNHAGIFNGNVISRT